MRAAVLQRASDIHIEPAIDGLRVRYRIDGVMAEVEQLPPEMQAVSLHASRFSPN